MPRIVLALVILLALAATRTAASPAGEPDRDGDGLSDFREVHKHFTDPDRADSDGDDVPDGDWAERREFAYTVRSVVRVLPPITRETLVDDYQDARVLRETDEFVELEVIHYPMNTIASAIAGSAVWRKVPADLKPYVAPGITSNWDRSMRTALLAALRKDGIDVAKLDDRAVAERVSAWLMSRTRGDPGFSHFFLHFPEGKPAVLPGLEKAVERWGVARSFEEDCARSVLARGMFEHRTRGSCTPTSIVLSGCLKAVGLPTRTILCIPVVDASDPAEMEMVRTGIRDPYVRRTILAALGGSANSWTSHTFNEVFVGGRWRRLNYSRLGQNILDRRCLGLMTHILTVSDWADAGVAPTVGRRQGLGLEDDVFGHKNPYSTVELSDAVGPHAKREHLPPDASDPPAERRRLTIVRAIWYGSPERPESVSMRLGSDGSGHVLFRVKENHPDGGTAQYAAFWQQVGKAFVLRAEGKPGVKAAAERRYWASGWFYLRIPAEELAKMERGVPYALAPVGGDGDPGWDVEEGVGLVRE